MPRLTISSQDSAHVGVLFTGDITVSIASASRKRSLSLLGETTKSIYNQSSIEFDDLRLLAPQQGDYMLEVSASPALISALVPLTIIPGLRLSVFNMSESV